MTTNDRPPVYGQITPDPQQPIAPPAPPAYLAAPHQPAPKADTITVPVIKGKAAAFLYLTTLLALVVIAWAQVSMALSAREDSERFELNYCAGETYGAEHYTEAEKDKFRELCGHAPRTSEE
ncbi:hypothetical protein [Streptomyces apocyni]|uniref:hypothetical protein n=1 Tax=Streptomyces apocyni TaxID=2654677 RepID=UPI0012EA58EA|nr:hypothetical protein [Streptomyces apocyni]